MYRLISNRIVVQTLHDIDLSGPRPLPLSLVTRFEPNSRPSTLRTLQFSFHFETAAMKSSFILGIYTPGNIRSSIIFEIGIHDTFQYQVTISHLITGLIVRHMSSPFRIGPRNFRPCCRVERSTIEVIFPHQLPSRRISRGDTRNQPA